MTVVLFIHSRGCDGAISWHHSLFWLIAVLLFEWTAICWFVWLYPSHGSKLFNYNVLWSSYYSITPIVSTLIIPILGGLHHFILHHFELIVFYNINISSSHLIHQHSYESMINIAIHSTSRAQYVIHIQYPPTWHFVISSCPVKIHPSPPRLKCRRRNIVIKNFL